MEMRFRRSILIAIILLLATGVYLGVVHPHVSEAGDGIAKVDEIGVVMETIALVTNRHFYQPVSPLKLIKSYVANGTINGMLSEVVEDDYTRYMDPQATEYMLSDTQGSFGGIGIVIGMREGQLTIVSPIKGTPGERVGLRSGDKIMAIDGKETAYMSQNEAVSLMRGPVGEAVTIIIQRGDEDEQLEVQIIRDMIEVDSVSEPKMLDGKIGYVQISSFTDRTAEELTTVLQLLDEQGMEALILDLRFNPGGTLSAAIRVADLFISSGPIVHLEDKDGNRTTYSATRAGTRPQIPMAVLINGGSDSGSEIVAGALQDHSIATLIGTDSFGKGLVQSIYPLSNGGSVAITEQVYLTSIGRDINKLGISPDIVVEISEEEEEALYFEEDSPDIQLEKAIEVLLEHLGRGSERGVA